MTDQETAEQWLYIVELLDETDTNEEWTAAVKSWLPVMQANLSHTEINYIHAWLARQTQHQPMQINDPQLETWAELLRLLTLFFNKIRSEPLQLLINIIVDLIRRINKKTSRIGCKSDANEVGLGANEVGLDANEVGLGANEKQVGANHEQT